MINGNNKQGIQHKEPFSNMNTSLD